jgi:hypothetical protein
MYIDRCYVVCCYAQFQIGVLLYSKISFAISTKHVTLEFNMNKWLLQSIKGERERERWKKIERESERERE